MANVVELGHSIVGTRAEDSSKAFSDAFPKVKLQSSRCRYDADREFVCIDCKQASANMQL